MAKSYEQLQSQIAALQKQADALRQKEAAGVIAQIKEAIVYYGLTAEDLGLGAASRGAGKQRAKAAAGGANGARKSARNAGRGKAVQRTANGVAKYRDAQGNSWSGRGPRPGWFKAALAQGRQPEDLLA